MPDRVLVFFMCQLLIGLCFIMMLASNGNTLHQPLYDEGISAATNQAVVESTSLLGDDEVADLFNNNDFGTHGNSTFLNVSEETAPVYPWEFANVPSFTDTMNDEQVIPPEDDFALLFGNSSQEEARHYNEKEELVLEEGGCCPMNGHQEDGLMNSGFNNSVPATMMPFNLDLVISGMTFEDHWDRITGTSLYTESNMHNFIHASGMSQRAIVFRPISMTFNDIYYTFIQAIMFRMQFNTSVFIPMLIGSNLKSGHWVYLELATNGEIYLFDPRRNANVTSAELAQEISDKFQGEPVRIIPGAQGWDDSINCGPLVLEHMRRRIMGTQQEETRSLAEIRNDHTRLLGQQTFNTDLMEDIDFIFGEFGPTPVEIAYEEDELFHDFEQVSVEFKSESPSTLAATTLTIKKGFKIIGMDYTTTKAVSRTHLDETDVSSLNLGSSINLLTLIRKAFQPPKTNKSAHGKPTGTLTIQIMNTSTQNVHTFSITIHGLQTWTWKSEKYNTGSSLVQIISIDGEVVREFNIYEEGEETNNELSNGEEKTEFESNEKKRKGSTSSEQVKRKKLNSTNALFEESSSCNIARRLEDRISVLDSPEYLFSLLLETTRFNEILGMLIMLVMYHFPSCK